MNRCKIAFVDGNPGSAAGLRRELAPFATRWEVRFFLQPDHALEALSREHFDVVVSDFGRPGMDGLSFLDEVRRRSPDIVRFVVSDLHQEITKLRTTGVAHHYLAKPCGTSTLQRSLKRASSLRHQLRSPHLASTIANTKTLPKAPTLYQQLTAELRTEEPSLARAGAIVGKDPAMTATIMRIVNSAYFGLRRPVTDIGQAVTLLGFNTITALVLSSHLFRQVRLSPRHAGAVEELQARSVETAALAKALLVSDASTRELGETAYLAGILSECGKLIFAANWPDAFVVTEGSGGDAAVEHQTFGCDHTLVGAYLLAMWGLPDDIVEAVAYRLTPSICEGGGSPVLAAVHVASALNARNGPGDEPALDSQFVEQTGLTDTVSHWMRIADELAVQRRHP
jgi:HD-like signal output (HDOD) protein